MIADFGIALFWEFILNKFHSKYIYFRQHYLFGNLQSKRSCPSPLERGWGEVNQETIN